MKYLLVPGQWLAACGHGDQDRTFRVRHIERKRPDGSRDFVTVDRDGHTWVIDKAIRGATYLAQPPKLTEQDMLVAGGDAADAIIHVTSHARYPMGLIVSNAVMAERDYARMLKLTQKMDRSPVYMSSDRSQGYYHCIASYASYNN